MSRKTQLYNKKKLRKLRKSIKKYGIITPIIVSADGEVIDGKHRVLIAKELKIGIPYIVIDAKAGYGIPKFTARGENFVT